MDIEQLIKEKQTELGVHQYVSLSTEILTFSDEVRKMCEMNSCGRYGKSWQCPPGVGEVSVWRDRIKKYPHALLFSTKSMLEDSFDFEGMTLAAERHGKISKKIYDLARPLVSDLKMLQAGSCSICEKCTYPDSPCRLADKVFPSIEAVGIDVVTLTRVLHMNYINGVNTVTYFTLLVY